MKTRLHLDTLVFTLLIVIVAAGAFAFRLPRLDRRPMHTDEAVHAVKLGILYDTGVYTYNPHEYHGPTLYYFSLPFVWLSGAHTYAEIGDEIPLRLVPVLFGTGLILLLLLITDGLGRPAAVCAAVLTAVSPAMVFYSRYYIQEILLVFFTFAVMVSGWRYARVRTLRWALVAGICLGFMYATKETCLVACGAMVGGMILTVLWTRWVDGKQALPRTRSPDGTVPVVLYRHAAAAVAVAALVAVLCLTVFLSQPRAMLDSVLAYVQYVHRAVTGDSSTHGLDVHRHPWHYYLRMLAFTRYRAGPWWSEAVILVLALAGIGDVLRKQRGSGPAEDSVGPAPVHLLRFLAFYTILMTVVYSAIPYKTPWCMLSFLHGMILMAGVGAVAVYRLVPTIPLKALAGALLALAVCQLTGQAYRSAFVFHADTRNPYVYAQTSPDLVKLANRAEQIAAVHPDGHEMLVKVIVPDSDYWPLPWYLRRFGHVGYWPAPPDEPDAAVIISAPELETSLDSRLRDSYQKEYFALRPGVLLLTYIRSDLWEEFLEGRR